MVTKKQFQGKTSIPEIHESRIISGLWRGQKFSFIAENGLRPTPDRIRETLFNWLSHDIYNANILDCFSGSGALSLEALSREAASAVLIEKSKKSANQLKQNLQKLSITNAQVICLDCLNWLNQPTKSAFHIIFVDPPFRQQLAKKVCRLLEKNNYTKEGSLIYTETEKELTDNFTPLSWKLIKSKQTKTISYQLWQR